MKDQHLVPPMAEKAERLEGQVTVEQQVGDEHHQPPAAELVDHPPERRFRGGTLARPEVAQGGQQLAPVTEPGPGRQDRPDVVVEGDQPGGVALPEQDQ